MQRVLFSAFLHVLSSIRTKSGVFSRLTSDGVKKVSISWALLTPPFGGRRPRIAQNTVCIAAPTPCPGQSTRQHESAVRPVLVHREHNHCCTVAMVIWKTFQALAAESHHKQCYTAGQDSRHTAQLKRVDICCQADKRGKAQKKHSSFSFFLGGGGVLLPFHYLPTMNFEKENKPQRKTRVLQRRPGRSSTKKASTAAWHCQKLSCQESKNKNITVTWDLLQSLVLLQETKR